MDPARQPARAASAPADAWQVADAQCTWWSARPDADRRGGRAACCSRRTQWAERAALLHDRLVVVDRGASTPADGATIADAFVVGAAALAHVRADPLLPVELCGRDWPGDALRVAYRAYEAAFSASVRDVVPEPLT